MKKALLTLVFVLFSIIYALAYDCLVDGIYYNLNKADKTASVAHKNGYNYTQAFITIPQEVTHNDITYKVTSIGNNAFYNCGSLTGITLPNSLTSIGNNAFFYCSSLTEIILPNSLTSIGDGAFWGCSSLPTITLPHSLTFIDNYAFRKCSSLTEITLPSSITFIGKKVFQHSGLKKIVVAPYMKNMISKEYQHLVKIDYKEGTIEEYIASKPFVSWEEYYTNRHKKTLLLADKESIARSISNDIEQWQKKGEFESTAQWNKRVNEETRTQKIDSLKNYYANRAQVEQREYKQEYEDLQKLYEAEYKAHYDKLYSEYVSPLVENKQNAFQQECFELKPYDADNQSFLMKAGSYGDVLLPVPIADAPNFKNNWENIKNNVTPTFVFDGKNAVLSKLTFKNGGKEYVYDSHTEAKYAVADIQYNFAPVNVDVVDFDIKDLEISAPAIAQANPGQTIAKQNESVAALDKKTVEVERRSLTAGNGGGGGTLTKSDVDVSIPRVSGSAQNTFALVIANENYRREESVEYAQNDGRIFAEYLKSTLGLPENNLQLYCDATLNDIRYGVNSWLTQIGDAFGKDANIIVYYAGHGIPDEKSGDAYLLPVDGHGSDVMTGYSIKELYETLGKLPSRQTLLLMDACFSGAQRDGSMMASNARGVRIKPKDNQVEGNLIVLSATHGDETAYPYAEQQHGMFTYFLLKKLKENKRDVTLGDLADYIITNVKRTSIVNNGKLQTPTVSVSPALESTWKSLRMAE